MKVLVIGAGDIGFQLSRRLTQDHHDVSVIELDSKIARRAGEQLDVQLIEGDATTWRILQQADVANVDIVAAMTTRDEVNLLACRMAKKAGAGFTIARIRNPELLNEDFILTREELGVDEVIHPELETADAVVRLIRQARATDLIDFAGGRLRLLGMRLESDSPLLRTPLEQLLSRPGHPPVRIAAIKRKQQTVIPSGKDVLVAGDQVYVVAEPKHCDQFIELTGQTDTDISNIMVLGGGLIGQFIARQLADDTNVKIVESNVERAWGIADALPDTLVIQGDGTDYDLLATEGIMDMDAFVAVTGDDENNIIASLLARHLQVPRVLALVNKVNYLPIMPTIGLDSVVSKQLLTVNAVLRFIQHRQVASIATIPGLDAHVIEFIAGEGAKVTKKPLRELHFPENAFIGAVTHGEQLEIPTGATQMKAGDKAVVFSLPRALDAVEKMFK
jgi:trk system potassium uptake protein TrkA